MVYATKYSRLSSFLISFKQDENVRIIAIGVGRSVDQKELKSIAMDNEKYVVHVNGFGDLVSTINEILKISCASRKMVRYLNVFQFYCLYGVPCPDKSSHRIVIMQRFSID